MVIVVIWQCWLLCRNPMEEVFLFNTVRSLKSLQWKSTLGNSKQNFYGIVSFVQTAANIKLNVQTELSAGIHLVVGLGYSINMNTKGIYFRYQLRSLYFLIDLWPFYSSFLWASESPWQKQWQEAGLEVVRVYEQNFKLSMKY